MTKIGRAKYNELVIDDPSVSSLHASLYLWQGRMVLKDEGSTNGSSINSLPVTEPKFLSDGDLVILGTVSFLVQDASDQALPDAPIVSLSSKGKNPPDTDSTPVVETGRNPEPVSTAVAETSPTSESVSTPDAETEQEAEQISTSAADSPEEHRPARSTSTPNIGRILSVIGAALLFFLLLPKACAPRERNMLTRQSAKAAASEWRRGVNLTVAEPAGIDRHTEPVTSGVPLPEGAVKNPQRLRLIDSQNKPIPCQFTPLSHWPGDGSVKWVLLDFQADVAASNSASFRLTRQGRAAAPHPASITTERRAGGGVRLTSGALTMEVSANEPGLVHAATIDGRPIITPDNPVQLRMRYADDRLFAASSPSEVSVECDGPLRTTILVKGHFVDAEGRTLYDRKAGYDLRLTVYAGHPEIKFDLTLRNDGWYGFRNEGRSHPRQWIYLKSLALTFPASLAQPATAANLGGMEFDLAPGVPASFSQWFKYNYVVTEQGRSDRDLGLAPYDLKPWHEKVAILDEGGYQFYSSWTNGYAFASQKNRGVGCASLLTGDNKPLLTLDARRFWENHPAGFEAEAQPNSNKARLDFVMLPEGGYWPRTQSAVSNLTYQVDGGRRKTWTVNLHLVGTTSTNGYRRMEAPLFARADTGWYRGTGAVLPLADNCGDCEKTTRDPLLAEAMHRYDRLQLAKARVEVGDRCKMHERYGRVDWGQVSIPSLWERVPDLFTGWMNFGDLVSEFGYVSLYYGWPYSMLIHYLRIGDPVLFELGNEMSIHRYDIDQYHVENTAPHLGGFQRYEKSSHGNLEKAAQGVTANAKRNFEMNPHSSHTWNRDLLLHWALTGDPRSLDAAQQTGRAFHRFLFGQHKIGEKEKRPWPEFRVPVWAIDNWLALYEYTGDQQCLAWATELFDKTLLAMERDNGSQGHIIPEGLHDSMFVGFMVEPLCRLHHATGRKDVLAMMHRVLDWQRNHGTVRGQERDGIYYPLMWRNNWYGKIDLDTRLTIEAANIYNHMFSDGFAYLDYTGQGGRDDLPFARRLFREIMLYCGMTSTKPEYRFPIGYFYGYTPLDYASKIHAWSGRYSQLFLQLEQNK